MRVRYLGKSDPLGLINGKTYDVISVECEGEMYRIVDETGEDYMYGTNEFEVVDTGEDE